MFLSVFNSFRKREWILGVITDILTFKAADGDDNNRFGLSKGTVYHLCSATPFQ